MKRSVRELGIYALIGIVTAGAVHLVRRNRLLTEENRILARRAVDPRPGLYVPELQAQTVDGKDITLGLERRHQVLFFFNTTCPYCRASIPAWKQLAARLVNDSTVDVYGIALDSAAVVATYAAQQRLTFPVVATSDPRLVGLYRVSSVPLTLVIDDNGRMAYTRLGELKSAAAIDSVVAAIRSDTVQKEGGA